MENLNLNFEELIIIVGEARVACGIKDTRSLRLSGSIGRPPTNQSVLLDNPKSGAEHRLGYFLSQYGAHHGVGLLL